MAKKNEWPRKVLIHQYEYAALVRTMDRLDKDILSIDMTSEDGTQIMCDYDMLADFRGRLLTGAP